VGPLPGIPGRFRGSAPAASPLREGDRQVAKREPPPFSPEGKGKQRTTPSLRGLARMALRAPREPQGRALSFLSAAAGPLRNGVPVVAFDAAGAAVRLGPSEAEGGPEGQSAPFLAQARRRFRRCSVVGLVGQ
jgi:hypothetical protein